MISFVIITRIDALGVATDWAFTPEGNVFWNENVLPSGAIVFDGPPEGQSAELTGCAVAVLDACTPDDTDCEVTLFNPSDAGELSVTLKGGDPVSFVFPSGGSMVTHTVRSGTGSGLAIICEDALTQSHVNRIRIDVHST
jgi:hypothetical protein